MSNTTIQFEARILVGSPICQDGICEIITANTGEDFNDPIDAASLFYFDSVTASVGWNKNDEFFTPLELFNARHSIINQPLNLEHNVDITIGHIMDSYILDSEHKRAGETVLEKFHLVSEGVLYKFPGRDAKRQKLALMIQQITKEIMSGESRWYVSMECVFAGFDYAIQEEDGSVTIVARTPQNQYMDPILRAYGGSGVYNGKRIGRALKGISFIGQGLVRRPASDESIIFANLNDIGVISEDNKYFEDHMTPEEIAALQKTHEEVVAEYKTNKEAWAAEKLALEKLMETTKASVETEKSELVAALDALKAEKEALATQLSEATEALAKIKADELKRCRQEAMAAVGIEVEYEAVASFTDAQFDIFVNTVKSVKEKAVTVDTKSNVPAEDTVKASVAESKEADAVTVVDAIMDSVEQKDNLALATVGVKDQRTEIQSFLNGLLNQKEEK